MHTLKYATDCIMQASFFFLEFVGLPYSVYDYGMNERIQVIFL